MIIFTLLAEVKLFFNTVVFLFAFAGAVVEREKLFFGMEKIKFSATAKGPR